MQFRDIYAQSQKYVSEITPQFYVDTRKHIKLKKPTFLWGLKFRGYKLSTFLTTIFTGIEPN